MKKILFVLMIFVLCGCQTLPTVNNILKSRTFHDNAYVLKLEKNRFGKKSYQTIYLFKVEEGFDATIRQSLLKDSDIEGAIRYMNIMMQQYKSDMRSRTALNISFLYYILDNRVELERYYQYANNQDFSDATQATLKQMTVLYPTY